MTGLRVFVAVLLPRAIQQVLFDTARALSEAPGGRLVRWTPRDNLHLTLKFIGQVEASRIASLSAAIQRACRLLTPFDITLAHLGCFPNPHRPRIVWAGVTEGTGQLVPLANEIDRALEPLGVQREQRPFTPHLTLGRARAEAPTAALNQLGMALVTQAPHVFGSFRVDSISLMASDLRPQGAVYRVLADIQLGAIDPTRHNSQH
ncbi:MAG: RNA 2',3'-cyclic phosphodiesterase [Anaerolineae bacterium]|jgi:2'-5' RNA ligase|nr:RNA 2',3'-cyclic phosphodiesterase [Chloroflexota bacterium]